MLRRAVAANLCEQGLEYSPEDEILITTGATVEFTRGSQPFSILATKCSFQIRSTMPITRQLLSWAACRGQCRQRSIMGGSFYRPSVSPKPARACGRLVAKHALESHGEQCSTKANWPKSSPWRKSGICGSLATRFTKASCTMAHATARRQPCPPVLVDGRCW